MHTPTEPGVIDLMATVESAPGQGELPDLELTRLGHYILLHEVGVGGMGVVYAAYDETLDRKVAIKLLRGVGEGEPRLLREAQAMARLSHPNVVQVFETGEHEGRGYIVMEFVEGETLGRWLLSPGRGRGELLAVYRGAAQGLIAAHAQSMVHRDFKPDNVMVREDGRVMVMDFGLARGGGREPSLEVFAESGEIRVPSSFSGITALTQTGAILGTPAYMAPEQFRGGGSEGAQADQFSFCVALWEGLYGCRPFAGGNMLALEEAILAGQLTVPSSHEVPGWLRRVLERGLAADPDERWPSMEALLEALGDDPTRRRRAWWGAGAALVLVGALVGGLARGELAARPAPVHDSEALLVSRCAVASHALDGVWSPGVRGQIRAAFVATDFAPAPEIWTRTAQTLDEFAGGWSRLRSESCLGSGGAPSPEDERVEACLDERAAVFTRVVEAWSEVDSQEVIRAPTAAASLPLLATCTDATLLALWVPPPAAPDAGGQVEVLRGQLDRAMALRLTSDYAGALELAEATLAEAETLGWRPLIAEARFQVGDLYEATGDYEGAKTMLASAFFEASAIGHERVAVRTAGKLAWTLGQRLHDTEAGLLWVSLGEAVVERTGLEGSLEQSRIEASKAAIYMREGEAERALEIYRGILAAREPVLGADDIQVAAVLNNIGLAQARQGRYGEALEALERAQAIREATLGAGHPQVGASLNNVSLALEGLGRYGEALERAVRAQGIFERALGREHPSSGASLNNVAYIHFEAGNYREARAQFEEALARKEATLGPDHPGLSNTLTNLGDALVAVGEYEQARDHLGRAASLRNQDSRAEHELGRADFAMAQVVLHAGGGQSTAVGLARSGREHYAAAGTGYADKVGAIDDWLADRE